MAKIPYNGDNKLIAGTSDSDSIYYSYSISDNVTILAGAGNDTVKIAGVSVTATITFPTLILAIIP